MKIKDFYNNIVIHCCIPTTHRWCWFRETSYTVVRRCNLYGRRNKGENMQMSNLTFSELERIAYAKDDTHAASLCAAAVECEHCNGTGSVFSTVDTKR